MKGDGRVFLRGKIWWVAFFGPGRKGSSTEIRESSHGDDRKAAERFLRRRVREVANHRTGIKDLVVVSRRLKLHGRRSTRTARSQLQHTREHFGLESVENISNARLRDYQEARLADGAKKATIDRELELLRRAFHIARRLGRVSHVPHFEHLLRKHENARKGFIEPWEFERLKGAIPDLDFRDFLEFFWLTAMRNAEIASLGWEGLREGNPPVLTLFAENSKTGKGRHIPIAGPVEPILRRRMERRADGCAYVFHRGGRSFREAHGGLPRSCYAMWRDACSKIGLPGLLVYDLRRSAIRNMRKAGVDDLTIMEISGHMTLDTFRRYLIEDVKRKANAFSRVGNHLDRERKRTATRTIHGQPDGKLVRFRGKNGSSGRI
jgi:integrase